MKQYFWISFAFLPAFAGAVADFARTPQEEAMCQAMIYSGRDQSERESWMHMHHFCDCIRFTNRAYSSLGNWNEMRYNLQIAVGGCDYVFQHAKPGFYMLPEVHLQKGKALRLYRQEGKALTEFLAAIRGNPKLPAAYIELADLQARSKKTQEALKTVTEGLRHNPDSKPLKRRYTELGGKLPYPTPIVPTPDPVTPNAAAAPAAPTNPSETTATPSVPSPAAPTVASPPTTTAPETIEPKIGSPKNPYCRFCPD